jgi:hypothetical protein
MTESNNSRENGVYSAAEIKKICLDAGDHRKAECKSDNLCFKPGFEGKGIYCVTREHEKANLG